MEFKVLSHACLFVRHGATSIVIDPWLLGSCYWRSWWNFPEPVFDEAELNGVDAVVISHIHWDHWHGPTLKKLLAGKRVIIPDEPGLRSEKDLHTIGFNDVQRVPHGLCVALGDLRITLYQFGRYLNDAAVVIEGGGVVLLNANDAKIAGPALRHIVSRHGPIDFAFRSHSSANPRICFEIIGDKGFVADDREHYFRSFMSFMDVVKPRYAIPFASNHCHLHDDVFALNGYISNPLELRKYCDQRGGLSWQLQVMLPGSRWEASAGFTLRDEHAFDDLPRALAEQREAAAPKLAQYRAQEQAVAISERILQRFMDYFKAKGKPASVTGRFLLRVRWPNGDGQTFQCDIDQGDCRVQEEGAKLPSAGLPMMEMPAIIFRDAVLKNMFHHAGISKRCRYLAVNADDMAQLVRMVGFLDNCELGVYPKSRAYRQRLYSTYVRRWRELLVYAHALWLLKVRKMPMYLVEEAVLKGQY